LKNLKLVFSIKFLISTKSIEGYEAYFNDFIYCLLSFACKHDASPMGNAA